MKKMFEYRFLRCFAKLASELLCCVVLLLGGCNFGGNLGNNSGLVSMGASPSAGITMGIVASIPVLPGTTARTALVVQNNRRQTLWLRSATLGSGMQIQVVNSANRWVNVAACATLLSGQECNVILTPPASSGAFLLQLVFQDSAGNSYRGAQIISYSSEVQQQNGFIYFAPPPLARTTDSGNTLAIPIILASDLAANQVAKIVAANTLATQLSLARDASAATGLFIANSRLECPDSPNQAGRMCTLFVKYTVSAPTISATNANNPFNARANPPLQLATTIHLADQVMIPLSLSTNGLGNLVSSGFNVQVNPVGSSTPTVTLLNNGVASVNNIAIYGMTPLNIQPGGSSPCLLNGLQSLASGASCTFQVGVTAATTSAASQVLISSSSGNNQNQNLTFNVYYTPAAPLTQLTQRALGWLMDSMLNSVSTAGVYILNSGNVSLTNLQFSNLALQVTGMSSGGAGQTCVAGQSLAPGASCVLLVNYAPIAAVAAGHSVYSGITASYLDQNGVSLSYSTSSLGLAYSANAATSQTYLVAGDYGALSAATTIASWSAQSQPPFAATTTAITRLVNNGATYLAGTNTGGLYQALGNGLIWSSANSPVATSISGLTYDNSNGYLATTNTTSLYSTPNLAGTSTVWSAHPSFFTTVGPYNLFNFGRTTAYFAPQNSITNAGAHQLALSTTPITATWSEATPSGAARPYLVALYDGNQYCVLSSTGYIACTSASGFSVASAWTQNLTQLTSATLIMAANNGSSSYVALNNTTPFAVHTASNPALLASAWINAASGPSAALSWLSYGNAAGLYVGVSAASPGLVWTTPDGTTWTQRSSGTANTPTNEPYAFDYYDGSNFWASGTNLLKVSPDGINWHNAGISSVTTNYSGTSLFYLAVGTAGGLESSTNLTSWTQLSSGSTQMLNHIKCYATNFCLIAGNNGTLLKSAASGLSGWQSESSTVNNNLAASACGFSNCVVVGANGTILLQTIGSSSWSSQLSGTTQNLNSVVFYPASNLYLVVGNAGVILTSPDGINWSAQNSGSSNNLNEIYCAYSTLGCLAVGSSGTVLASSKGLFWQTMTSATGVVNGVGFYNGVWVLGENGGIIQSASDTVLPMVWTTRSSGVTVAANLNFNSVLAY